MKADGQAIEKLKHLLYLSQKNIQHQKEVAIILKKDTERQMLEWKPVSSRLIKLRMRGKHLKMTILQGYNPANNKENVVKDLFYKQLQAEVEITLQHDILVDMGEITLEVESANRK